MSIDIYLKQIRKYAPMTREEEIACFTKAKAGDRNSYEKIMQSNLRFVISVAKKYQNQGVELEDLIAEGNVGLLRAYEKFDVTKNYKFITYAVWWIRQAIINSIHENSKVIRLPNNKIANIVKVQKVKDKAEQELEQYISYEALAEYVDDPAIIDDLKYHYTMIGIEEPQTDNEQDLTNILADPENNIEALIEIVADELSDILKDFTDREREILYMYYGINLIRPYSLKEIGMDVGLTRERIRQIKEKILERLREKNLSDRLRGYLK